MILPVYFSLIHMTLTSLLRHTYSCWLDSLQSSRKFHSSQHWDKHQCFPRATVCLTVREITKRNSCVKDAVDFSTLINVTLQAILMPLPKRHLTRLERHIMSYIMYKSRVKSLVNIFCLWGDTITPTSDLAFPHSKANVAWFSTYLSRLVDASYILIPQWACQD